MPEEATQKTKNEARGIRGAGTRYKESVQGSFYQKSISSKASSNTQGVVTRNGLEEAGVAVGSEFVTKKARQMRRRSIKQTPRKGRVYDEGAKKLEGPGFWLMVMLAITKDTFDLVFAISFFLSFLSILMGIVMGLAIVFYLVFNDVSFTTRKVVTFVATTIIEFIPLISGILPATTINLLLIRKFENDDRLRSSVEKKMANKEALVKKLSLVS